MVSGLLLFSALVFVPAVCWRAINSVSDYHAPIRVLPSPNGYLRAAAILSHAPEGLLDPSPNWRELSPRILAPRVARLQPALDGVKAQFSLPWAVPGQRDEQRPRLDWCATWYAIRSRLALQSGRPSEAMDHCLDAMELGNLVCRNGWIYDRYDGQACQFTGLERAERILPNLPADHLLQQIQRVRRLRQSWTPTTETLANERITSLRKCAEHLREVERQSLWEQLETAEQRQAGLPYIPTIGWSWPRHVYAWPAWQQVLTPHGAARAELDHYFEELIAATGRPAPHGVPHTDPTNIWVKQFAASSFTGPYRGEWPRNNLAILETAMAVRLYCLRTGRYPHGLDELPKAWLPEIPQDVWNQPIAYRLANGKGVVYSWGPDQKDDGGRPVNPTAVLKGAHGDLVFGKLCDEDWPKPRPRSVTRHLATRSIVAH